MMSPARSASRQASRPIGLTTRPARTSCRRPRGWPASRSRCIRSGRTAKTVFLTQAAATDPNIVAEIERHLRSGDNVIITSGLLRAIQDKGFDQVTDMRVTHEVVPATEYVEGFGFGAGTVLGHSKPILFPLIHFYTNEEWAVLRGIANQGACRSC